MCNDCGGKGGSNVKPCTGCKGRGVKIQTIQVGRSEDGECFVQNDPLNSKIILLL